MTRVTSEQWQMTVGNEFCRLLMFLIVICFYWSCCSTLSQGFNNAMWLYGSVNRTLHLPFFKKYNQTSKYLIDPLPLSQRIEVPLVRNWATTQPAAHKSTSVSYFESPSVISGARNAMWQHWNRKGTISLLKQTEVGQYYKDTLWH